MTLHDYALVSLADCKAVLGITNSAQDDRIIFLINALTDYIEGLCQRRFKQTTYTGATAEVLSGNGTMDLFLSAYPVSSGLTLEYNNSEDNSSNWESVDTTDFFVDLDAGLITGIGNNYRGVQNYRATYTGGYSTIPSDLQYAVIMGVGEGLNRKMSQGIKSESLGDHSVVFDVSVMAEETGLFKKIVAKYKRYNLHYGV